MKTMKILSYFSIFTGILSGIAQVFQFLALSDIAHNEPDSTLEWKVTGLCMLITIVFIILAVISFIYLLMRYLPDQKREN